MANNFLNYFFSYIGSSILLLIFPVLVSADESILITGETWKENPGFAINKACDLSGEQGEQEFQNKLHPSYQHKYNEWKAITQSQPITAPSFSDPVFEFCPKTSTCGLVINWFLSMHPSARLRKESTFISIKNIAWRMKWKHQVQNWSDVRELLISRQSSQQNYNDKEEQLLTSLVNAIKNKSKVDQNGFLIQSGLKGLCLKSKDTVKCNQAINKAFSIISPAYLTSKDTDSPINFFNLTLATPDEIQKIFFDFRYAMTLKQVNLKILDRIENLELIARDGQANFFDVGSLDMDLDEAIRNNFNCSARSCIDSKKNDVLAFYGSRGTSFLGLVNYIPSASLPTLLQFGAFAHFLNYLESLQVATHNQSSGFYTLKQTSASNCLQAKPYHLLLARALSSRLISEGFDRKTAAVATLLLSYAYRLASDSPSQVRLDDLQNSASTYFQIKRLDLIYNAIGIAHGINLEYEVSPELLLAGLNHLNNPDALRHIKFLARPYLIQKQSNQFSWNYVKATMKDIFGRIQLVDNLGINEILQIFSSMQE